MKSSNTVTVISTIGFVFGMVGMLGSFIPFIGSLAFYIGIPAAFISAVGLVIAKTKNAKQTFSIIALTVSLIGVAVSGWQYVTIYSLGKKTEKQLHHQLLNQGRSRITEENKQPDEPYAFKVIDPKNRREK